MKGALFLRCHKCDHGEWVSQGLAREWQCERCYKKENVESQTEIGWKSLYFEQKELTREYKKLLLEVLEGKY